MLDALGPGLLNLTGPAALSLVAILVITDKLVWHRRLEHERAQRERWEGIALRSLGVAEKLTIQAEVTNDVLTKLPVGLDPES